LKVIIKKVFRKLIHTFLVVVLIFFTTGIIINRHYCNGSFISFSIFSHPKSCCGKDCNTCHNVTVMYKVTDNFAASHYEFKAQDLSLIAIISFEKELIYSFKLYSNQHFYSFGAPPINNSSAFLKVFRC